ncbi:hypothetical protein Tco_0334813, partial [Tanacetum coccineum]
SFKPVDETNSAFRAFEVDRLAAHELFVATLTMTTVNQGMSVEKIEQVVAQRVANAIEAIATYETKTNMARKSMSQTKREKDKVAENASNVTPLNWVASE